MTCCSGKTRFVFSEAELTQGSVTERDVLAPDLFLH